MNESFAHFIVACIASVADNAEQRRTSEEARRDPAQYNTSEQRLIAPLQLQPSSSNGFPRRGQRPRPWASACPLPLVSANQRAPFISHSVAKAAAAYR
jgi:hypothetical protein